MSTEFSTFIGFKDGKGETNVTYAGIINFDKGQTIEVQHGDNISPGTYFLDETKTKTVFASEIGYGIFTREYTFIKGILDKKGDDKK